MAAISNFEFLKEHDPIFQQLAAAAEHAFASDPNTTLIKLRQLGEAFAQDIAARSAIAFDHSISQLDLLARIDREIRLDPTIRSLFHILRVEGNKATHRFQTRHREAMDGLKTARALAIWYHQSFGKHGASFKPGPFVAPVDPSRELRELQAQIEQLNTQLREASEQADNHQQLAELMAREKFEYAELAEQMDADARTYEQLARETEQKLAQQQAEFDARLQSLQQQLEQQSTQAAKQITDKLAKGAAQFDLDEDLTRILIDQQLIDAGWAADSTTLRFDNGTRPQRGKNIAIAE
jgi:type I restriction enzyme R subunit